MSHVRKNVQAVASSIHVSHHCHIGISTEACKQRETLLRYVRPTVLRGTPNVRWTTLDVNQMELPSVYIVLLSRGTHGQSKKMRSTIGTCPNETV